MFSETTVQVPCIVCHGMTWIDTAIENPEDAACTSKDCRTEVRNMTGAIHRHYVEILKDRR